MQNEFPCDSRHGRNELILDLEFLFSLTSHSNSLHPSAGTLTDCSISNLFRIWSSFHFGFLKLGSTMAGLAIVLDLLRKNPVLSTPQSLHPYGAFSAAAAVASAAAGTPFAYRAFLGYVLMHQCFLCLLSWVCFFVIEKIGYFQFTFRCWMIYLNWIRLLRFVVLKKCKLCSWVISSVNLLLIIGYPFWYLN